jgi:disulfide bond formation protein DsbB
MKVFVRTINAFLMITVMGVITAAFYQQFFRKEQPCPLCLLQRLGMIGVATGCMMNLKFGLKIRHYALSILSAIFGAVVAGRQILLHICPDFPVFGIPVLGLSLYVWSFIVFTCAVFGIVLMLFLYNPINRDPIPINWFETIAIVYVIAVTLVNFILVVKQCGWGFCTDVPWPQPGTPHA